MTSLSRKFGFRFTLGKLLALVAVFAMILAGYSRLSSGYRQARMSADTLGALGGSVVWSPDSLWRNASFPFIVGVDLRNGKLTEEAYAALARIPGSFLLQIHSKFFDPVNTGRLVEIKNLSSLSLAPSPVEESAIRKFQQQRPDVRVTVGRYGEPSYREYPRSDD